MKTLPQIETSRLLLKVYEPEDLDSLYAIRSDPDITKYFPDFYEPASKEKLREAIIRHQNRWRENGFGEFCVIDKTSGDIIGYCGLQIFEQIGEVEIYYGFFKQFWGSGFATEAAQAVLKHAFEKAKLPRVIGITHYENKTSQRVLEKIGLQFVEEINCYDIKCLYYDISSASYKKTNS